MSDLIKIMMVEDDEHVCEAYKRKIRKYNQMEIVYVTGSESEALSYLENHIVDAIILDLELQEGDGTSFLLKMKSRIPILPYVMVVTNTGSSVILSLVRENGADYVYQKTNIMYNEEKILSMIKKAMPYKEQCVQRQVMADIATEEDLVHSREMKRHIYQSLMEIGFKAGVLGTSYLQDMLYAGMKQKTQLDDTRVKELYEETAHLNNTYAVNVERNVRSAIESTWKQTNLENLQKHYPFDWDRQKGKPTNKEFVINMIRHLS